MTDAVFAIPGDMHRKTGGFIYEAKLLDALRGLGLEVTHLQLPAGFPEASASEMDDTAAALCAIPAGVPVILDGFVSGTVTPEILQAMTAPRIAMVHHPLGLETGLSATRSATLLASERAALAHMDHVVVPSPHTREILMAEFGVPETRISIALPGFEHSTPLRAVQNPPLILSVGLLAPRKGHDVLLNALGALRDLAWQAVIVGGTYDASYARDLHVQCTDLGLNERVIFKGELDSAGVAAQFAMASIFALATRYEGYGMVFGEAMLHGLPIVSCDGGAVRDTVGDAGIIVPVGGASAFAEALRGLLENAEMRDELAKTSADRGAALPVWADTATVMARVIRDLAPLR